jgi:hypothetical protein
MDERKPRQRPEVGLGPPSDPPRDRGFEEVPAEVLKTPPKIPPGEDSGEWTRGGGTDPNEASPESRKDRKTPPKG